MDDTMQAKPQETSLMGRSRMVLAVTLAVVFVLGAGLRLLDLTDPPLDFYAFRQLRSAAIARAYYYDILPEADPATRQLADQLGTFSDLEPRILEHIVAWTYRLAGGEFLWIARAYSILFWLIGGLALYDLTRRLTSVEGAVLALLVYFLNQFAVIASRSFQPDPFMVMWTLLALDALLRWTEAHQWRWGFLAAVLGGLAILVKVFAVYFVGGAAVALALSVWGLRRTVRDPQTWAVAALMGAIPAAYYLVEHASSAAGYLSYWTIGFSRLLLQVRFWFQWLGLLNRLFDLLVVVLALVSVTLMPRRGRALCVGLWAGYLLFGMSVPSLIISHEYYSLPVTALLAISVAPLGALVSSRIASQPRFWQLAFAGVVIAAVTYVSWMDRNVLFAHNYRFEPATWRQIGESLPKDGPMIGITHDGNTRLLYYGWVAVGGWPQVGDLAMRDLAGGTNNVNDPAWRKVFAERTRGYAYFVVTLPGELDAQPVLKSILTNEYVSTQRYGYILFDLRRKTG